MKQGRGRESERATEHYKKEAENPILPSFQLGKSGVAGLTNGGCGLASEEQAKPATRVDRANLRPTNKKEKLAKLS